MQARFNGPFEYIVWFYYSIKHLPLYTDFLIDLLKKLNVIRLHLVQQELIALLNQLLLAEHLLIIVRFRKLGEVILLSKLVDIQEILDAFRCRFTKLITYVFNLEMLVFSGEISYL